MKERGKSEIRGNQKMQLAPIARMAEGDLCGMEKEAAGSCAIEGIANDGGMKPFGMGTVDAQLMGAPRDGKKM